MNFTGLKRFVISFISPVSHQKKNYRMLNFLWLVLASISLVAGIILGIKYDILDTTSFALRIFDVWYILSLVCIVPFLPAFIKCLANAIRGAVSVGKRIKYTETSVNEVQMGSGIYEVRKRRKNAGAILGYIWGVLYFIILALMFVFVGVAFLAGRFVLTIKEIRKYTPQTNNNQNIDVR